MEIRANYRKNNAFSLVELSIVLVILGLLTGGILAGQNLIRASELRAVVSELEAFRTATMTFHDQYSDLPGDMSDATDYWGAADTSGVGGECGDPTTDTGTGTDTCNGDGNGIIESFGTTLNERFRFWQHMVNAGLVEGNYPGTGIDTDVGVNIPESKLKNAGWYTASMSSQSSDPTYFDGDYGNVLVFGADSASAWPSGGVMLPEEAWNIDTKIDDGKPGYGNMRSFKSSAAAPWNTGCSDTDDRDTAKYNVTSSVDCSFLFIPGW